MKQTANILVITHSQGGRKEIPPGAALDGVSEGDLANLRRMGVLVEPEPASTAPKGASRNTGASVPEPAITAATAATTDRP